jgi:hypothetical protein
LGTGPRHLWNLWPETTQKGLHEIYLKYKEIKNDMFFIYLCISMSWYFHVL